MSEFQYTDYWLWAKPDEPALQPSAPASAESLELPTAPSTAVLNPVIDPEEEAPFEVRIEAAILPTAAPERRPTENPDSPDALRWRAALAIQAGDWKTAEDLERRLLEAGEDTSALTYNIGVLQQRAGLVQEAVPSYKRALEQNPNFAEALLNLGHAFKTLGRDGDAQSAWLAALTIQPDLASGYFKPWLEAARQPDSLPGSSADTIRTSK